MGAGAQLANPEELAIIHQGAKAWNNWREKNQERASFNLSCADLHGRDLTGADLRGVDLSNAILRGATLGQGTKLWNANLSNADLYQTNLRGADLQDVNFSNADLYQADLRETNLQGADLSTAKGGLLSHQLAGSDLTGAKLPGPLDKLYAELSSAKEISSNAQKLFLALLAGCLYSWLTIAQTNDVELITNRATTPLPIIQAAIPIVGFYVVAPLILLCLYFYFHFYLQKLWEELGSLPAVFTDGRELHKRTDPWLLNDLVRSHFIKLKDGRPFLSYFQSWISVVLAWWLVPITLLAFWLRFMHRHDLSWSIFHALLLTISVMAALRLYHLANSTLRGYERTVFLISDVMKRPSNYLRVSFAASLGTVFVAVSYSVLLADSPRNLVPRTMGFVGYSPFANLANADVSIKPPNWTGKKDEELDLVKGATLEHSDLRGARAYSAFFAKARLSGANLQHSFLPLADLRQADLSNASLTYAFLEYAQLRGADLMFASLAWADLTGADLTGATFAGADVSDATFSASTIKYADLRTPENSPKFVFGLTKDQIVSCRNWNLAFYDPDMLKQLGLPLDHNETLQKQMEAEQQQAKSAATTPATPK
jgi:uncharacterized protein YjbI with pentapeptide repeats